MSKRSDLWEKKRAQLVRKEQKLKEEFEEVSEEFKSHALQIATIALVAGGVAWMGYMAFKAITSKNNKAEIPKNPVIDKSKNSSATKTRSLFNWKSLVLEKLLTTAVTALSTQIASSLTNKSGDS